MSGNPMEYDDYGNTPGMLRAVREVVTKYGAHAIRRMPFSVLVVAHTEPLRLRYRQLILAGIARLPALQSGSCTINLTDIHSAIGAPAYDAVLWDGSMTPWEESSAVYKGHQRDAFLRLRTVLPPGEDLTVVEGQGTQTYRRKGHAKDE